MYKTGRNWWCRIKKYESLHIFPIGTVPPNPTELLEDGRLGKLIEELRNEYDYIFLDCPPIDIVADTQIIENWPTAPSLCTCRAA